MLFDWHQLEIVAWPKTISSEKFEKWAKIKREAVLYWGLSRWDSMVLMRGLQGMPACNLEWGEIGAVLHCQQVIHSASHTHENKTHFQRAGSVWKVQNGRLTLHQLEWERSAGFRALAAVSFSLCWSTKGEHLGRGSLLILTKGT